MMYMHYCAYCDRIHILNGHKALCPGCGQSLTELAVSFLEFSNMDADERARYQSRCHDKGQLLRLSAAYR